MARKRSRTRIAAAGGGLLGLGLLVAWLLNLLPNFEGPGTGKPTDDVAVSLTNPQQTVDGGSEPETSQTTPSPSSGELEVVDVLIDDYDYYLRSAEKSDGLKPVALDEVIELARQATGNEDGIRVRITPRANARYTAQSRLTQRLTEAGLSRDEIFLLQDFADR